MTTQDWKQLTASALIGTSRQEPKLAEDAPGDDSESRLLASAALTSVCLRAGWSPSTESIAALPPSPPDELPIVWEGELHLHQLVLGHRSLLWEWIREANHCRVLAPPSSHTALLELALSSGKGERDQILQAIGDRGAWLANLNPRWSNLLIRSTTEEAWIDGSFAERVSALRSARGLSAAHGRDLLSSVWAKEQARERAAFLASLQANLGSEDQDLLEKALSDKSIEVRRIAVSLLAQLPNSSIAQQAISIALTAVNVYKSFLGTKVEINLPPEEPTPFDVLDEFVPNAGDRASKLARTIGCVPPIAWRQENGRSIGEMYQLLGRHEFSDVVRRGFEIAAVRFRDTDAATAVFRNWMDKPGEIPSDLLPYVSESTLDEARVSLIRSKNKAALPLLLTAKSWSGSTSRAFLDKYLSADNDYLRAIDSAEAARRLSPEVIDEALASITPEMERAFKRWLEILPLRRDMIRTIRRSANR